MAAGRARRLARLAMVALAVVALPYLVVVALFAIGGGNHRSVAWRSVSPDGAHEARLQNDRRGSIQPVDWRIYVKPSRTASDDPAASCAVADVTGEDAPARVAVAWQGPVLAIRPDASADLHLRHPPAGRCRPGPAIRLFAYRAR